MELVIKDIRSAIDPYKEPKNLPEDLESYSDYTSVYIGFGGICIVFLRIIQIIDEYNYTTDKTSNDKNAKLPASEKMSQWFFAETIFHISKMSRKFKKARCRS